MRLTPLLRSLRENAQRLAAYRAAHSPGPLTAAEKILAAHLDAPQEQPMKRGATYLRLRPDRVALQDASAQTAILQFLLTRLPRTAVPTSVHCDHLIVGSADGSEADLQRAIAENREVFDFLHSSSRRYALSFWPPGSGIIHQIVLENYAAPGLLMIGCDSHTPNAGGLGGLAIGVGGADAVDVMSGMTWELKAPKIIGVHLKGKLNAWTSPKDIILALAGRLTVKGGTGHIIEYFGEGARSLSCTGMATVCNMGAEVGATTSIFPYTPSHGAYLTATGRDAVRKEAEQHLDILQPDEGCHYDQVITLDLSTLEPHLNGPFTPDLATPLSAMAKTAAEKDWPLEVSAALIGSCTNSSYEDMTRAASIAKQALDRGLKVKMPFFITPGSDQIFQTCKRDGLLDIFTAVGGTVLANACGPCIGQWDRRDMQPGKANSILSSFNRNFSSRNDGNKHTHNFLCSPELVMAMAFAGRLDFNPLTDAIQDNQGNSFHFQPPAGSPLPAAGFKKGRSEFNAVGTPEPDSTAQVSIDPASTRLEALAPFPAWDGKDLTDLRILIKVAGKCTTDHISAAGPWLKYKGHLTNISENTLITATNAENGKMNCVRNLLVSDAASQDAYGTVPAVARAYKAAGLRWIVIGDENYGEGSAREHAAMQPRFLGGVAVICRSFARIHETNLKKQGMLPLTFANRDDYNKVPANAVVDILGLADGELTPSSQLRLHVRPPGQPAFDIPLKHTLSEDQIKYFKAGSALNAIAEEAARRAQA